jgi:phosphopantothenoylcysteine decarboxylase/phosphopantothenate--cysteine ligase
MTNGAKQFITPLSVASLSQEKVYDALFDLKDEVEMGHIRLSRDADIVLVAPASANIISKVAHGVADDLASTLLLATNKPVLMAPAMNHHMWMHKAVQRNVSQLKEDGIEFIGPASGLMACNEEGEGRMVEVDDLLIALEAALRCTKSLK